MGLSICRNLAELMGGAISVESQPDQGSRFCLDLPFMLSMQNIDVSVAGSSAIIISPPERPLTVLIAEDNQLNLHTIDQFLKKLGHRTVCTENGQEALEKWREGGIDIILMDINMPVMSGIEAFEQIRKEEEVIDSRIPVIALSWSGFVRQPEG